MGKRFSDSDLRDRFEGVERYLRGLGRAITEHGDSPDLVHLRSLHDDIEAAMAVAVAGLREQGHSWATIGAALGISRASAQQHYGRQSSMV